MVDTKKWHKHYPTEIPTSLTYDKRALHEFLEDSAKDYGKKKALYFMGKELTYEELYQAVQKMAGYYQSLGLKKGDKVAIMLPNCPQGVISYFGALMCG